VVIVKNLNHVNLESIQGFQEQIQKDPAKRRKTQVIEGEWILEKENGQFQATLKFEKGETILKCDSPIFMGGEGNFPGPLHYCFYGLLSCYTGVFATVCSMMGIELKRLHSKVEGDLNFSRVFGLTEEPIMEEVRVKLMVESDAPEEKIREAERMASERCPAVYTMTHIVKFSPQLEILASKK
jgi:uncharacterized OsmC-like protein